MENSSIEVRKKLLEALFKNYFGLNFFLATRRNQFWQTCRKRFLKKRKIFYQWPKVTKRFIRTSSYWSLKCYPRRVKRSFDNPVEIYSRKNRMFFARALKLAKKDFRRKPLLKLIQWTVRMHFWKTWRYIFVRKQFFSVCKSESDKQNSTSFFPKNIEFEELLWTRRMQFWQPSW